MSEDALTLKSRERSLVGVLTRPDPENFSETKTALLLLNSGLLHHVGPNRISVLLARSLVTAGILSFRFDFSGVGDSPPADDDASFEERAIKDIQVVMDHLQREEGVERFVLYGMCSGAEAALAAALRDPRVWACVLVNGGLIGRDARIAAVPASLARTRARYYAKRLRSGRGLTRFLTLKTNYSALRKTVQALVRPARRSSSLDSYSGPRPDSYLDRLAQRDVRILIVYSEGSPTLEMYRSFLEEPIRRLQAAGKPISLEFVPNTDHMFTLEWSRKHLITTTRRWLADLCPAS